jgi:erythromycin esterase-like protein
MSDSLPSAVPFPARVRRLAGLVCACLIASAAAPVVAAAPEKLAADHAEALGRIVGPADTVIFGEDSHGMQAVHEIVPQLFRHLVEEQGFRVFVFEVQWETTTGLADFLNSDRTALNSMDSYWLNGAFASQPIADMLVWIREWNLAHPDDPIQIAGYQPENPVADLRGLLPYLERVGGADASALIAEIAACRAQDPAYATDLDFVIAQGQRMGKGLPNYTEEDRASCLDGLSAIRRYLDRHDARIAGMTQPEERILTDVRLISLVAYVGVIRQALDVWASAMDADPEVQSLLQGVVYGQGDEARFEIYRRLRDLRFPNQKVFHWMHNWHAFRNASAAGQLSGEVGIPRTTVSIGQRIAAEQGRDVRILLNIVPCNDTCKEPEASLESEIAAAFGKQDVLVGFGGDGPISEIAGKSGTLYANHHNMGFSGVVLEDQADGLLYLRRSGRVGR